jgi:ABC-type uncharacterized transport system fused permease/ATPase subunit
MSLSLPRFEGWSVVRLCQSVMSLSSIWCILWDHQLLETLNDNATLLTKVVSTMFVLVVVGSLLLSLTLNISKAAANSTYRTKGEDSNSSNLETA